MARSKAGPPGPRPTPARQAEAILERKAAGDPAPFHDLLARARAGDEGSLPVLRELMDRRPRAFTGGDLARQALLAMAERAHGRDLADREMARRQVEALGRELAEGSPAPVVRLLAERAALCWYAVHVAEAILAQKAETFTFPKIDFHQGRIDRLHRRYLSALRALAQVQRLRLPTVVRLEVGRPETVLEVGPGVG